MTILLIQYLLLAVIISVWNAYVILEITTSSIYPELSKQYSKIWHFVGWILRFQIAVLIAYGIYQNTGFVYLDWLLILKWELLYIVVASIGYDLIINVIRYIYNGAPPIFYIDNKNINAFFIKYLGYTGYWIARLVFLIGTILFLAI